MKVEIWSDVMCPFCYIGKRRFEEALSRFPNKDHVEVVWKSFELNPALVTNPQKSVTEYLAETKGWTLEYTQQVQAHVIDMAKEVGLHYDFDKAVMANSFDAHRLIQLAKTKGKGDAAEERLFKAYFTEGKNTADHDTLTQLGTEIGLDAQEIKILLEGNEFAEAVQRDEYEARQIGVRGVPYFVFNDKYAVSGAQLAETFLGALTQAYAEWTPPKEKPIELTGEGTSCTIDGECE